MNTIERKALFMKLKRAMRPYHFVEIHLDHDPVNYEPQLSVSVAVGNVIDPNFSTALGTCGRTVGERWPYATVTANESKLTFYIH